MSRSSPTEGPGTEIEAALAGYVSSLNLPKALVEAIAYSLLGGGKRIRPRLAWHSCEAVGADPRESLVGGVAIELIHAFSLVHDDLPAMDDDDMRRAKPSLHLHAGEAMAILAGDSMLALAFGILSRECEPMLARRLTREIETGTQHMIAGQVYDTLGGLDPSSSELEQLLMIHRNKTGALIRASCRVGAVSGLSSLGRDTSDDGVELTAISTYADRIGLMFQIVDDLLDVEQTSEHAGKKTGKDLDAGKLTYPGVLGVESSRAEVDRLRREARDALEPLGPGAAALREMCQSMAVRTK